MTLLINQTGRWIHCTTAETTALPLTQYTCLVTKHSEGGWLRNHVVSSSQSTWLDSSEETRRNISFFLLVLIKKRPKMMFFMTSFWSLTRSSHLSAPLSSTEMRRCARLQGDLADFNSFTPDYALEHLLCGLPPQHPLKDKTSQKPVQTIRLPCCSGERNVAFLAKEAQNNYVCIHVLVSVAAFSLAPEATSPQILQPNMSSALP